MGRKRPRDKVPGVDVSGPMVLPSHDLADGLGKRMVLQAMVSRPHGLAATPWSLGMGEADRTNDKKEERLGWITRAVPGTRGLTDFEPFFNGNVMAPNPRESKEEPRSFFRRETSHKVPGYTGPKRAQQQEEIPAKGRKLEEEVCSGSDGSGSESMVEKEKPEQRGGRAIERILNEKKGPKHWRAKAVAFRKKFLSASSNLARNSRRRQMMSILKQVKDGPELPVTAEELTVAATLLDEAKLVSADQYLHEVKLMQVEMGETWGLTLERQLKLCKAALSRNKGPEKRAKEVQVDLIDKEVWVNLGTRPADLVNPAWCYAWATVWMLRAAEAAKVLVKHVSLKHSPRHVTLFIPVSKMDQKAKGVSRTLQCCGLKECHRWCAWGLALKTLAAHKTGKPGDALFPLVNGRKPKKSGMVRNWQKFLSKEMGGHSARRSGAMAHARAGMNVTCISYLGRWRSTAVFRYVEEALQFLPSNSASTKEKAENYADGDKTAHGECISSEQFLRSQASDPSDSKVGKTIEVKKKEINNNTYVNEVKIGEVEHVYAVAPKRGGGRIAHSVSRAAWGMDLDSWSTACGWRFAKRFEKVQLMTDIPAKAHKCSKCESILKGRDFVMGGLTLAQMLSNQFSNARKSKDDVMA